MSEEEFLTLIEKKLFEIADAMMEYYDCCHMVGDSCKGYPDGGNLCCFHTTYGPGLCKFMYDNKCHNPNSSCRLWLCKTSIQSTDPKCVEGLRLLSEFGYLFEVVRKPLIGHPYSGADKQKRERDA